MTFWIVAVAMAALVTLPVALTVARAKRDEAASADLAVYRDQLSEIERDRARGLIDAEEAERVTLEVQRRILEADRRGARNDVRTAPLWARGGVALGLAALVVAGGVAIYARVGAPGYDDFPLDTRLRLAQEARAARPSQSDAEAAMAGQAPPPNPDPEVSALTERLRGIVAGRPDDLQGHVLLARYEAVVGDYAAARRAQERVIALKGDDAEARDYAILADLMVAAAGGWVTPDAEDAADAALARDPAQGLAAFYKGLTFEQTGRPDVAFAIWSEALDTASPDDPGAALIRSRIEGAAAAAGRRFELPPDAPSPDAPGPSAADVAASAEMAPEERVAMIRSMVDGLSERLATEGGTADEWARLVRALGVLGDTDRAGAIWEEAQQVFANAPQALAQVRSAAQAAGVAP